MSFKNSFVFFLPNQAAAFVSLGAIVISTFCFILSTFPDLQDEQELQEQQQEQEEEEEAKAAEQEVRSE